MSVSTAGSSKLKALLLNEGAKNMNQGMHLCESVHFRFSLPGHFLVIWESVSESRKFIVSFNDLIRMSVFYCYVM